MHLCNVQRSSSIDKPRDIRFSCWAIGFYPPLAWQASNIFRHFSLRKTKIIRKSLIKLLGSENDLWARGSLHSQFSFYRIPTTESIHRLFAPPLWLQSLVKNCTKMVFKSHGQNNTWRQLKQSEEWILGWPIARE